MKTVTMALCLAALTWVGATDLQAQDRGTTLAAMAMWGTFDVSPDVMESASGGPATGRCQTGQPGMRCDLTHPTSDPTVCRGAAVAYVAVAVYALVQAGQRGSLTTFTTMCSRHRVVIVWQPDRQTTGTEYERSSGDVIYRKSIRS